MHYLRSMESVHDAQTRGRIREVCWEGFRRGMIFWNALILGGSALAAPLSFFDKDHYPNLGAAYAALMILVLLAGFVLFCRMTLDWLSEPYERIDFSDWEAKYDTRVLLYFGIRLFELASMALALVLTVATLPLVGLAGAHSEIAAYAVAIAAVPVYTAVVNAGMAFARYAVFVWCPREKRA